MSRCFPYPPPGYNGSKASNEALIESIKLQRESEKAKAERKKEKETKEDRKERKEKEKKDKKDKKRDKKLKKDRKEKDRGKQNLIGCEDGKAHRPLVETKGVFKEKIRDDVVEQMERSGLTEEHNLPVSVHKPSYSSDSTENSNKRKRPVPSSPSGITGHGNVIRIRLPLRRHREPDLGKEPICSTSGRSDLSAPLRNETPLQIHQIDDNKPRCLTPGTNKVFAQIDEPIPTTSSRFDKKLQAASSLYKELIENWVPSAPQIESSCFDDDEWLFRPKHQDERHGEKRYKPSIDLSCRGSSKLQPHALYLQEADLYALPYTLPF